MIHLVKGFARTSVKKVLRKKFRNIQPIRHNRNGIMVAKRSFVKDSEDTTLLLPQKKFTIMFGNEKIKDVLKLSQRVAYGVGHVMNDICSAMWFSYTLLFFEVILEMPSSMAGVLIFIGQVADAVASPIIGILVDRYGTRKSWHMFGTTLIAFSFSLIFSKCPWDPETPAEHHNKTQPGFTEAGQKFSTLELTLEVFYYGFLIVIFQTGWATVQIAHLAIIPDMTPNKSERADLTAIRYTATVCSSVFVYLITWLILHITEGSEHSLGPKDFYKFKDVVLIGLLAGGTFTMLFHAILNSRNNAAETNKEVLSKTKSSWFTVIKDYFKSWPLYQVTLLYFSSRMILNISLVYMPMYLVENVGNNAEYIATVPLVSYVASFVASLGVRQVTSFCSSKTSYLIGGLQCIGACIWIGIGLYHTGELFGISILLGAGSSITGVASLCLCADLIGTDTQNGAFLYSIVTAVDKLLGGIVVIIIESFKCKTSKNSHYYQDVLAYGCGVSTIMGLLALCTMYNTSKQVSKINLNEENSDSAQA